MKTKPSLFPYAKFFSVFCITAQSGWKEEDISRLDPFLPKMRNLLLLHLIASAEALVLGVAGAGMVVVVVGAGLHLDAGKLAVIALIVVAAASYAAADGLIADPVLAHFRFSFSCCFG